MGILLYHKYCRGIMLKKILFGIVTVILLVAIPLTVYLLGQQQETRTEATPSTTLSLVLSSPSVSIKTGDNFGVDVTINPGTNQVSFVKLSIGYESSKIGTSQAGFEVSKSSFPVILEGPVYMDSNILITVSVGADPTKVIQSPTKVGKITFKALAGTGGASAQVARFNSATQVLSIASSDTPSENVLSTTTPLSLNIPGGEPVVSPTTTVPVCTALNADKTPTGSAPFTISFTANGSDADGTIAKVSFDFGDGPLQDVTQGGGIGTKNVSVQTSHTYVNPGTFAGKATLTDNQGNVSTDSSCTKTVTVTAAGGSGSGTGQTGGTGQVSSPTATLAPVPTLTPTLIPSLAPSQTGAVGTVPTAPPGSAETVMFMGGVGFILTLLGAALLFGL